MIFHIHDDPLLKYNKDDNQKIEPEWYIPIIPMLLVNGADGIGTGWMTKIPNYNPREIVKNIKRMLDGDDPLPMVGFYCFLFSIFLEIISMLAQANTTFLFISFDLVKQHKNFRNLGTKDSKEKSNPTEIPGTLSAGKYPSSHTTGWKSPNCQSEHGLRPTKKTYWNLCCTEWRTKSLP